MDSFEKLKILTDAAKYDVACTSSGVARGGRAWLDRECRFLRNLSLLCGRRPLYLAPEGFNDQLLQL